MQNGGSDRFKYIRQITSNKKMRFIEQAKDIIGKVLKKIK